ncbi:lipocalin family protein, partial [Klebsiella pneumoniae]|uniref:lipocalin family protein n=1 Tax=Klebsiella pneumoniae TaxID=573 RepID=UPI003968AE14
GQEYLLQSGDLIVIPPYALVSGPNRDYLWILSRTPTIPAAVKQDYLNTARELGFDVDRLVWIRQTPR